VAAAEDEQVTKAVAEAINRQLAAFTLFGDKERIAWLLEEEQKGLSRHEKITIEHVPSRMKAAEEAVKAVKLNKAEVLMKGQIATATLLQAVLNKEWGLRTGKTLSHVAAFEIPGFERLIFITDAAMNIAPDLVQKKHIV
jgi:phosphate butyryltransferase